MGMARVPRPQKCHEDASLWPCYAAGRGLVLASWDWEADGGTKQVSRCDPALLIVVDHLIEGIANERSRGKRFFVCEPVVPR